MIDVPRGETTIPCSVWSADDDTGGIVVLGHGFGVDRYHDTVRRPVEVLTREFGATVVVPEIPLHGVRDEFPDDPSGIIERWQNYWVAGGAQRIADEFLQLIDFCRESYGSKVTRIADNSNHLHEQPTIFYALVLCAAMLGAVDGVQIALAWGYVAIRIVHSLIHATRNIIFLRFLVFAFGSLILLALLLHTVYLVA